MLTKERINEHVWVVYGDNEQDVSKAFVRFQEYYENKDLKGKKNITIIDVEDWWYSYRQNLETEDSYYQYWSGFNLPGKIILDLLRLPNFRSNVMHYNNEETEFVVLLEDLSVDEIVSSYFIGMWKNASEVLDHEIAHAYFSTNKKYKMEQMVNVSNLPNNVYAAIRNQLSDIGYAAEVMHDEIQAYFSTYVDSIPDTFETHEFDSYVNPFVDTFNKFHTKSPS